MLLHKKRKYEKVEERPYTLRVCISGGDYRAARFSVDNAGLDELADEIRDAVAREGIATEKTDRSGNPYRTIEIRESVDLEKGTANNGKQRRLTYYSTMSNEMLSEILQQSMFPDKDLPTVTVLSGLPEIKWSHVFPDGPLSGSIVGLTNWPGPRKWQWDYKITPKDGRFSVSLLGSNEAWDGMENYVEAAKMVCHTHYNKLVQGLFKK